MNHKLNVLIGTVEVFAEREREDAMVSERVACKKNHCSAAAAVVIVGIVAITFLSLSLPLSLGRRVTTLK